MQLYTFGGQKKQEDRKSRILNCSEDICKTKLLFLNRRVVEKKSNIYSAVTISQAP